MVRNIAKALICAGLVTLPISEASAEQKAYTVSAGSISGSWFAIMTNLFEVYRNNIDDLTYTTIPGGSVANPIAVGSGQAQFALSYSTNLYAATRGDAPYKQEFTDLRAIANTGLSAYIHPFFKAKLGIDSIDDLATQEIRLKIDTGPRGTGGELAAGRVLAAHGASYDSIDSWGGSITYSPYREAMDRVNDGQIDAFINDEIPGQPLFAEFAARDDVLLLSQNADAIAKLNADYGYSPGVIPAGTYEGQDQDIQTTFQTPLFLTSADMDEEVVYQMTKLLFEKQDDLIAGHAAFKHLNLETAATGLTIPLHPGAERYYREMGVLK